MLTGKRSSAWQESTNLPLTSTLPKPKSVSPSWSPASPSPPATGTEFEWNHFGLKNHLKIPYTFGLGLLYTEKNFKNVLLKNQNGVSTVFDAKIQAQFVSIESLSHPSTLQRGMLSNDGHSIKFTVDESNGAGVSGGPLKSAYTLAQFHLHWGSRRGQGPDSIEKFFACKTTLVSGYMTSGFMFFLSVFA